MGEETIALNRKARHEFSIDETFEAGLVLTGSEIKSIRAHKVNLADAYARVERGEAWLIGAHIAPFEQGNRNNHEPKRMRKLLLHRSEIDELLGRRHRPRSVVVIGRAARPRARERHRVARRDRRCRGGGRAAASHVPAPARSWPCRD